MATLLPNAEQTFVDANGVPLEAGLVYMYVPGTLTPKDTWQDSGATVLNTNPIVLDDAGRAIIYGSGIYRQIVYNSAGDLIWDQLTSDTAQGGVGWGGQSTGTPNAQVIAASSFTEQDGQQISFIVGPGLTNNGPLTVAPGGSPAIAVLFDASTGPQPLAGGEVVEGNEITLVYEAARGAFHLVNPASGVISGTTITNSTIETSTILLKQATDPAPTAEGDIEWSTLFNTLNIGDSAGTQRFWAGAAPGAIFGCTIANNASDATNDIDFASGTAVDSTNLWYMVASALTKRLDSTWVVGTNQGGLFSGAVANGTYHCFIIMRPDTGVVDAGFSTSAVAADRPGAYTLYRRIGSIVRASAAILGFSQDGDEFLLKVPRLDINTTVGTAAALQTLTVPLGIKVKAITDLNANVGAGTSIMWSSPDQTDTAPVVNGLGLTFASSTYSHNGKLIRTNTSGQIRARSTQAATSILGTTHGWIDGRGRTG